MLAAINIIINIVTMDLYIPVIFQVAGLLAALVRPNHLLE